MRTEFDPLSSLSYGKWHCPTCDSTFFGGGPSLHSEGCDVKDQEYEACIYLFTKEEVTRLKNGDPTLGPLTLNQLRQNHPALLT